MRVIENKILETTNSPVKGILNDLHLAIINIAPERASEFDEKFKSFTIEYLDDDAFVADVDSITKHIRVSTGAVELLWVLAYAHFQYYTQVIQKVGCENEIEIGSDHLSGMLPAIALLDWAMGRLLKYLEWKIKGGIRPDTNSWPLELPSPLSSSDNSSDAGIASELTLGSIAVLIHHELAHIALGHVGASEIESERDADFYAWDWILDSNQTGGDAAEVKRMLILINATLVESRRRYSTATQHLNWASKKH